MAGVRRLVSAVTEDDLATLTIRRLTGPLYRVKLWASCVTVTDTIGMAVGDVEILPSGTMNIRAAALGLVHTSDDQLLFEMLVGNRAGDLRLFVRTLTTSLIYLLSVEPATIG